MVNKKKKPKFNVPNLGFFKSVKARWRKPRGTHNKKRMRFKWTGASPKIGYKNASEIRGTRDGTKEILIHNMSELEGLKNVLVRFSASLGGKKRKLLADKAKALGLKVVNFGTKEKFQPKSKPKAKKGERS